MSLPLCKQGSMELLSWEDKLKALESREADSGEKRSAPGRRRSQDECTTIEARRAPSSTHGDRAPTLFQGGMAFSSKCLYSVNYARLRELDLSPTSSVVPLRGAVG